MKIKLTCRKVAIKFAVLFCATFLSMWICCAVMALGGDIQGRNLFVIVSAFCILSLYHIISCYHQKETSLGEDNAKMQHKDDRNLTMHKWLYNVNVFC